MRSVESLIREGYTLSLGQCLSRGGQLFGSFGGGFVGYTLLTFLISLGVNFFPLGGIVNSCLSGPFAAGYFIPGFQVSRQRQPQFGDFFKSFELFVPIFLASLVMGVFALIVMIPCSIPFIAKIVQLVFANQELLQGLESFSEIDEPSWADFEPFIPFVLEILPVIAGIIAVSLLVGFLFRLIYLFTFPLILDKKLEFWAAMEGSRKVVLKQFGILFILLGILDTLNFLGALIFGVGLLVTIPYTFCVIAASYETIFGLEDATERPLPLFPG